MYGSVREALRVSACLACMLPVADAASQAPSPEVRSLALPLVAHANVETHRQHGCSQSYASSSGTTTFELTIDAAGAARLIVDGHQSDMIARSPYAMDSSPPIHTTALAHAVFTGRAIAMTSGLEIAFDAVDHASIVYSGWGTGPLPAAQHSAIAFTLRCGLASAEVFPSEPRPGETATTLQLLHCERDASQTLHPSIPDVLPIELGGRETIRTEIIDERFGGGPTRTLRRARP